MRKTGSEDWVYKNRSSSSVIARLLGPSRAIFRSPTIFKDEALFGGQGTLLRSIVLTAPAIFFNKQTRIFSIQESIEDWRTITSYHRSRLSPRSVLTHLPSVGQLCTNYVPFSATLHRRVKRWSTIAGISDLVAVLGGHDCIEYQRMSVPPLMPTRGLRHRLYVAPLDPSIQRDIAIRTSAGLLRAVSEAILLLC